MLTPAQIFALGTDIRANDGVGEFPPIGQIGDVADWYNTPDTSTYVFKSSMDTDEANKAIDWNEVLDAETPLSAIQQFVLDRLFKNGTLDPSNPSNRQALVDVFPGGGDYDATRAALLAMATRHPTRTEVLFVTNGSAPAGGDGSAQDKAAMLAFEGSVSTADIDAALEATAP